MYTETSHYTIPIQTGDYPQNIKEIFTCFSFILFIIFYYTYKIINIFIFLTGTIENILLPLGSAELELYGNVKNDQNLSLTHNFCFKNTKKLSL